MRRLLWLVLFGALGCRDDDVIAGTSTVVETADLDAIPVSGKKPLGVGALRAGLYEVRAASLSDTCKRDAVAPMQGVEGLRIEERAKGEQASFAAFTCSRPGECTTPLVTFGEQDDIGRVHGELVEPGTLEGASCKGAKVSDGHLEPLSSTARRIVVTERSGTIPAQNGACTPEGAKQAAAAMPCRLLVLDVALVKP
jgi:hypothetical protein